MHILSLHNCFLLMNIFYLRKTVLCDNNMQNESYALNIVKITSVIHIYKSMSPMKNGVNSINIFYAGLHKSFPIHYSHLKKKI